jgi:MFS family permease
VVTVLLTGQLLSALDQTIVGTALLTMVGEFGRVDSFSLLVTSYLLTSVAATAIYGRLADSFGAKPNYVIAIGIFTGGSLLVGLGQNMTQLLLFRAVQGVGAGGLVVWHHQPGSAHGPTAGEIRRITTQGSSVITVDQLAEVRRLRDEYRFFHWHLDFPDVLP